VNEAKVNLTLSELVVKMDEIEFECTISSKVDVIDRMKIQKKLSFPQKVACKNFALAWGKVR